MKEINLTQTADAVVWADEWYRHIENNPTIPKDKGCMIGWFSNAIMAGNDEHQFRFKRMSRLKRVWYAWKNRSW